MIGKNFKILIKKILLALMIFEAGSPIVAIVCPSLSLAQQKSIKTEWLLLLREYGWPRPKVHPPRVCISAQKFQEIAGGATMASVYDRVTDMVFLRHWDLAALRHELAHAWLERKFPGLPYSVAENLVLCMPIMSSVFPTTVDRDRIRYWLQRLPYGYCDDPVAAKAVLELSVAELRELLLGN